MSHGCDDISQEEVSELHFAKRADQDVVDRLEHFQSTLQIADVEREAAHGRKADDQKHCEVGEVVREQIVQFDLNKLPSQAEEPYKEVHQGNSEELVMDHRVVYLDLKYECIIDTSLTEDLDSYTSARYYRYDAECEEVHFDT